MFPVATKQDGNGIAIPDVCLVQAGPAKVPTPFVNVAKLPMVVASVTQVTVLGCPVIVKADKSPLTQGDAPGDGQLSGTRMGPMIFKDASQKLFVKGHPAVLHLKPTGQNGDANANAQGIVMTPSQMKLLAAG
jgi:hypothetical protein